MSSLSSDRAVLLRFHEIALKGANRGWFEDRLAINARKLVDRALGKKNSVAVERENGRILLRTQGQGDELPDAAREALQRVFGATSFSPVRIVKTDLDVITQAAIEEFRAHVGVGPVPATFCVRTRRSAKALGKTSMEIDHHVGGAIGALYPSMTVSIKHAEAKVGIEIHRDHTYVWSRKIPGPGGLPVGSNGPLLTLLSGGLDSPVAAIQVLKRGTTTGLLHFSGAPFVGDEVLEKVEDLTRLVNRFQPDPQPLFIVRFGKIQEKIALATSPKMRTVLYRRMMVRIASRVAAKCGAQALVTGESLGQVASQTLENLSTIDAVADIPILRPLIAWDKEEIIDLSHKLGTFETSIRPGTDCCTLFADRHPAIRATRESVEEQEAKFPVDELVEEALKLTEMRKP